MLRPTVSSRAAALAAGLLLAAGPSPAAAQSAPAGPEAGSTAAAPAATSAPGPSVRVVSSGHGLQTARMKTFNAKVDVAGAATLKAWVILPASAVAASGATLMGPVPGANAEPFTLARLAIDRPPSERLKLRFQFGGEAQERLLRFFKVTVTLRISATDAAGNTTTVDQAVALAD